MTGPQLVELYLLSQMRAHEQVAGALAQRGHDRAALDQAGERARASGLEDPGHPMTRYSSLLGEPLERLELDSVDPYLARVDRYALGLWPHVLLCVHGSAAGETSGLSFAAHPSLAAEAVRKVESLRPWQTVLSQLPSAARVLHEWYPQRDVECTLEGQRWRMAFDFGLLQTVERVALDR